MTTSADDSSSGGGDKGNVTISGQSFDEAALVASMYQLLLEDEGYTVEQKLVKSRDQYLGELTKGNVDVVPEYTGGIVDLLNTLENGADADAAHHARRAGVDRRRAAAAGEEQHHPARPVRGDGHQRVLRDQGVLRGQRRHQALRPRGQVRRARRRPRLRGPHRLRGWPHRRPTASTSPRSSPTGFGGAATYKSVLDDESQLGLTATTDGSLESQGLVLLEDDKKIQPAQNLVPAINSDWLADHQDVEDVLNELMATLTTEDLAELNNRVSVDREKAADVAQDYLTEKEPALGSSRMTTT